MYNLLYFTRYCFCFISIFRWQELEEEIVNYPEFHTNNFTVITLPILKNIKFPLAEDGFTDLSYFSIDCFHLNQKCHAIGKCNN